MSGSFDASSVVKKEKQFVSRGGVKLQFALDNFKIDVTGKVVLDVGSSTGGFVDCLLQRGVAKVYSVDTAYGELAWKLRNDPRVVVMERTNILHLSSLPTSRHPELVSGSSKSNEKIPKQVQHDKEGDVQVDLITIDASWTKLELILPVVEKFLKPDGQIIALLKPHYQANKKDLVKGILPTEIAEQVKNEVLFKIENLKFKISGVIESPILGGGGNTEYLLLIKL